VAVKILLPVTLFLAVCAFSLAFYLGKNRGPESGTVQKGQTRWRRARAELKGDFLQRLRTAFDPEKVAVPSGVLESTAGCMADRATEFLDTTGCRLTYVPSEQSEVRHLKEQAGCLQRNGYPQQLESITLQCLRVELPDDWRMAVPAIESEMQQRLYEAGIPDAEAGKYAACYAGMAALALDESGCPLIDRQASRVEDLITGHEDCTGQADMQRELVRFMGVCTGGKYPLAADAPQAGAGRVDQRESAPDPSGSLAGIVSPKGQQCPLDYHRRGDLCLHSELLSLEPRVLDAIVRSFRQGGPVPAISEK